MRIKVYGDFGEQPPLHLGIGGDITAESPSHPILARLDELVRSTNEHGVNLLQDISKSYNRSSSVSTISMQKLAITHMNCRLKFN